MIIGMLGGITTEIIPAAQINPVERAPSYFLEIIIGISIAPNAAVSATAEPDNPANINPEMIAT